MAEEIAISESNIADQPTNFSTLDDTTDQLLAKPEAIDIYSNVVGNPVTGSNPQKNKPNLGTLDFADSLADAALKQTSTQEDPYIKMRPFTYSGDYDAANFDRYYGTKAYKTLGFSPYRDNDALYNQKMTFGDQFVRAASQWDNLMATGFMSGVKAWGTMFTDPLAPDLDSARDMKRSMAIGNVSTGGAGAFVANTFLNSAYSIGIGLEFLAEEAALAAATALTGGMAGEVTLPAMAARGGLLGRQFSKIAEMGAKLGGTSDKFADAAKLYERSGQFAKTAAKTAGGNDINSARQYFNKVASGAFDMVNPLESTVTALKSTRYANDLAKTVGTAGAFMDDIIRIKTAASEAQLEGGMVKIDATQKLIDQYREMHGKDPEGEDLKKIEDLSSIEARRTTLYNFPAILTTNKLLFSTILYPLNKTLGKTSTRVLEDLVAEDGMKALSKDPFKVIGRSAGAQAKAAAKSLTKPALYGTYGMTYLKANVAEGLQENIQEAISQGAIEHALAVQKDPGMAAYRGYMGYLMDGLKDQVSAQGAETFASGFLMGMFTQPIMTAPAWAVSKGIERFKSKEERDLAKTQRDEALAKQQATLNDMANNDINYWAPDIATAVKNGALSNDLTEAASIGDEKSARDAKFRLEFNHIETAITSGKFEDLMAKLADYKNLTPEEALEAFQRYGIGINTKEDAVKALEQMDGVVERARAIKDQYERVAQDFPNPYNLSGLRPGTKDFEAMADSHMAWQEAQRNLVFATTEFDNYSKRIQKMTDAFSALASGIAKEDAQSLIATTSKRGLADEIRTLKQELKSFDDLIVPAGVKKAKARSLELLENFQTAIETAQKEILAENITDYNEKQVIYQDAKQAYQKYLTYLAKKNDTILFNKTADQAFNILTDNLEMRDEQHTLAKSINVLNNPKGFLNLQKRLQEAFGQDRSERDLRIIENLTTFMTMQDENNVIQTMGKLGVKVPEEFLADYKDALKAKKTLPSPTYFVEPSTQSKLTEESNPAKFAQALEVWDAFKLWMEMNHGIKEPVTEQVIATEEDEQAIKDFNGYDQTLQDNLTALYNQAKLDKEIPEEVSLAGFLQTYPKAIIAIKTAETAVKLNEEASTVSTTTATPTTDWDDLVSKAVSENELDKIMDQIDKATDMTPELFDLIAKKRTTFEAVPADIEAKKADIEKIKKIENEGGILNASPSEGSEAWFKKALALEKDSYKVTLTKDEIKEVKRQFKLKDDKDLSAKEFSEWIREFSDRVMKRVKAELAALEKPTDTEAKKIELEKKLKLVDQQLEDADKDYSSGRINDSDIKRIETALERKRGQIIDALAALGYPVEQVTEEEVFGVTKSPVEVIEQPIPAVNPAYIGKVIFVTPGSGKTKLAEDNEDIIDTDDLLIETLYELYPDIKISPDLSKATNIYEAIKYQEVDKVKLYNIARTKMKEMAAKGKTVITSSTQLMKNADYVMNQTDPDFILEKYDRIKELTEDTGKALIIGISQDIQDAIKKSPLELVGGIETPATEESVIEPTIDDINQNLTVNNLQIAQDRGYDAIYKDSRYAITKVDEKTVSLKAMDGTTIEAPVEEITAVTDAEAVVTTPDENKDFKGNDSTIKEIKIVLDDTKTKQQRIQDLKNKFC